MSAQSRRTLEIGLALLVAASSIGCIVLPVLGTGRFFSAFNEPYSAQEHFQLLAGQLIGPSYTLLLSLALLVLVMLRKRLHWWSWLAGLIGPIYTACAVGELRHDFSHAVFKECSTIYGTWIDGFSMIGGAALATLALLAFLSHRRSKSTGSSTGHASSPDPSAAP